MIRSRLFEIIVGFACLLCTFQGSSAEAESIDLTIDSVVSVHVTAISPTIFRVSIQSGGTIGAQLHSVFIDPSFTPDDVGKGDAVAGHRRIATSSGSIDIDPAAGTMSLLDVHGNVIDPTRAHRSKSVASRPATRF